MPTFNNAGEMNVYLFLNHVIVRFRVPHEIVTDHGKHFWNYIITKLAGKLRLSHEKSTPYYPQANKQVKAIIKFIKIVVQRMIGVHKLD